MRNLLIATCGLILGVMAAVPLQAAGPKLGKIFIRVQVVEGEFTDAKLVDSVKDLQKKPHDFIVVDNEADADYLIEVLSRSEAQVSGRRSEKTVVATISFREGTSWKPGIKVSKGHTYWTTSADRIMGEFEKWAKVRSIK